LLYRSLLTFLATCALAACTQPVAEPTDPQDFLQKEHRERFDRIKVGVSQEQVERIYGLPTVWIYYYEAGIYQAGIAIFQQGALSGVQASDAHHKLSWPVAVGMSRSEVEMKLGTPGKACAGRYYREGYTHYFCYRNGVLIEKERMVPPLQ